MNYNNFFISHYDDLFQNIAGTVSALERRYDIDIDNLYSDYIFRYRMDTPKFIKWENEINEKHRKEKNKKLLNDLLTKDIDELKEIYK